MLKKVGLAIAALMIGGMVFAQKSVDLKASPKAAGSVNAEWAWKGTPKGKIGESDTVFTKRYEIAATGADKGAKFAIVKGTCKFKTENGVTAIYHGTKGSATIDNLEKTKKAEYEFVLDDAATVEFGVTGNGSAGPERCVAVKEGENLLLSIDNLDQDNPVEVITLNNAKAGTYRILLNGARIVTIKAHN